MNFAIIASKKDKAGMNIVNHLNNNSQLPIFYTNKEIIYAENIDKNINHDFIIFASKHESKKGKPSLTVHAPGNWDEAKFGGKQKQLCNTSALFCKHLFQTLNKEARQAGLDSKYDITLEVTHHGPLIEKPCCFIEIGSSEKEWENEKAGQTIANTIINAISSFNNDNKKIAIGIGGRHYAHNFTKIQLNSDYALGHIIPQYAFPITKSKLKQAINKTKEKVDIALLDWKGMKGKQRQNTIGLLEDLNLNYERTTNIDK